MSETGNDNQEIDRMVNEMKDADAIKTLARVAQTAKDARKDLDMVLADGIELKVVVQAQADPEKDSMEVGPADCRVKVYFDLNNPDNVRAKLKAAQESVEEAKRLGLVPLPKEPKVQVKGKTVTKADKAEAEGGEQ